MEDETYAVFFALGNQVRRAMVNRLFNGPATAVDFAAMFDISTMGAIKHLKILEDADLITRQKVGRRNICTLNKSKLRAVSDWPDLLEVSWLDMLILESK